MSTAVGFFGMVHFEQNHLYKFWTVAVVSYRVYTCAVGMPRLQIVKDAASFLNHAGFSISSQSIF